ncbi:MAG: response regulator [Desulfobacteraceae bacterium]|nr:MAG: response regulator [Desulfobacteraceae bacterium]
MEKTGSQEKGTILIAEDDFDDRLLLEMAFCAFENSCEIRFVLDGEELMEYLNHRGPYEDPRTSPRPELILLDLNMPKKNGHQALLEIRDDPLLKEIPVAIWTTSRSEKDMLFCRNIGADQFLTKPSSFADVVAAVKMLTALYADPEFSQKAPLPPEGETPNIAKASPT